jgi:head-tail adaptor
MPLESSGRFRKRIVILTVSRAAQGANGEEIGSWPDPDIGTNEYSAAVESFGANEIVAQGQAHAIGSKRLRIRGRSIAVTTADRIRDKVTGEVYAVSSVARDDWDTIIDVERVKGQETAQ